MLQSLQSASIPSRTELQKFTSRPVRFGFVPVQTTRSRGLRLEARLARQVHPAVAAVEEHRDVVNSRALGHDRGPLRRWHVRVPRERVPDAELGGRKGHVHRRSPDLVVVEKCRIEKRRAEGKHRGAVEFRLDCVTSEVEPQLSTWTNQTPGGEGGVSLTTYYRAGKRVLFSKRFQAYFSSNEKIIHRAF